MTLSQVRRTENLIASGNIFRDVVDNIAEIFKRYQQGDISDPDDDSELTYISRVTKIYRNDVIQIPETPAISIVWTSFDEKVRAIGHSYPVTIEITSHVAIYYYHDEINVDIRKDEIRDALWEFARLLRRNADLNGLSPKGAVISNGQLMNRMRNAKPYAGGLINVDVPIDVKSRRGVS